MLPKERGITKIGYLVLLLFLAVFGYLGYRIVPVYMDQYAFDEDLLALAGTATKSGWDNGKIMNQVVKLGKSKSFQIKAKDIRIHRPRGKSGFNMDVNYSRSEEFPGGYVWVFQFSSSTEASLWF